MRVRVICFGVLREVFGGDECTVEMPNQPTDPAQVLDRLAEAYPGFQPHRPRTACALGEAFVTADTPIDGSEPLVLLPPVSGG